jgi:quercetin dioxygenase-like cupin family protein
MDTAADGAANELAAHRILPRTRTTFVSGRDFPSIRMGDLEGRQTAGNVELKPMIVGREMLMVEIFEPAGVRIPPHAHDDHESVVYLIRGRMRLEIGDETFEAQAGDAWIHPRGVIHASETLEDCLAVEIKSPPRRTWETA